MIKEGIKFISTNLYLHIEEASKVVSPKDSRTRSSVPI